MENSYSQRDIETLKNRAEAGDADAQELWGMALHYGNGVEEDYDEANRWYQRAAEQGLPLSQGRMGWNYLTGNSIVEQDIEKGFSLLKTAIEAEDDGAYASMSLAYSHGLGVEPDPEHAVSLAQKAIERGMQSRNRCALADALLMRDLQDVDPSELKSLYESVLVAEDADLALKEIAAERLEIVEKTRAANKLRDDLRLSSEVLGPKAFKQAGEDFLKAVHDIFDEETPDEVLDETLPSSFIQSYLDTFKETQGKWYESYADSNGSVVSIHAGGGLEFGYNSHTVIVEGDETPYLVLDQDGKVRKLSPSYELDEDSLGDFDSPLVCTPINVGGDVALVRYIPGRDDYAYPIWEQDAELQVNPELLFAIDNSVGSLSTEKLGSYVLGRLLYQTAIGLQSALATEGLILADIVDELPEFFDSLRSNLGVSTAENADIEEGDKEQDNDFDPSENEQIDQDAESEVPMDFNALQDAAFQAMEQLYSVMQDVVNDPDMNMGDFPFFVQRGGREVLLVLHEDGSVDRLEEDYELPDGSFSQDVEGLITVEVPVPLGVLRFIQVLPDTQW